MARLRQSTPVEPDEARGPVLPFELTFHFGSYDDAYEHHLARVAWLREHGIDTDDRAAVAAVERESRLAYGAVDSLSRARVMAEGRAARGGGSGVLKRF